MEPITVRHGCLSLAFVACLAAAAAGDDAVPVQTNAVDIEYAVNEDALPLDSVQLWYTIDRGATWREYGFDEDRQSPVTFHASEEGLYGFFLVVRNATGPSSVPPASGAQPHRWAFVDYTPPVIQLHPLRQTTLLGQPVLQIRWTAIDANFGARPVEIAYQRPPADEWVSIMENPLSNTGRYDWRLPGDVVGPMSIRLTVSDRGNHRVHTEPQAIEVARAVEVAQLLQGPGPMAIAASAPEHDTDLPAVETARLAGSPRAKERAARLLEEARIYQERGEYREGIALLREAVRLDPHSAEAFAEMADMLYRIGDSDRALNAYELALRQQPSMRNALRGAAMVYRQRNDHATAGRYLRAILRYNPNDAEVWMNLGDVAVFQGDEVLARECYTRAAEIDPDATGVIEDARKRLALMAEVSRTYRQGDGK